MSKNFLRYTQIKCTVMLLNLTYNVPASQVFKEYYAQVSAKVGL